MPVLRSFIIIALLFIHSVPTASGAAAPTKVVIGFAAMNARVAPLWITEEQGILAKYGLQAQQVFLRGAPTLVAGMASGDINFGRSGGSATLAAVGAGVFPSVDAACEALVQTAHTTHASPGVAAQMNERYDAYRRIYPALRQIQHDNKRQQAHV